ncbi:uncharacterized protein LOC131350772 [Hemibagrus wyckioides]|uniref:uncharacterized protein LOC131350772 n=1 Tax=Hemibagrus wyckioides TaxID=337641 RepID=UPI00266D039C|nr:uncharacterized protein LOC131350772 [Hemibagrus wyckioides]
MASQGKRLHIVTWNTQGIRSPSQKFSNVLSCLNDLQADVVFIQETRVGTKNYRMLTDVRDWKIYFTVNNSSSKGVAILINNNVPFNYICHDEDCSGGYIVLFCHLYGELYTLVSVYKHKADRTVLGRLKEYLMEAAEGVLVVGGDFNTVLHPSFDRSPSDSNHSAFRSILEDFTVSLNLRDTWSYLRFADEGFTRHQNDSHSRLDMFFMRSDTMRLVCGIRVEDNEISDHNPVVLVLEVQEQTESKFPKVALLLKTATHTGIRKPNRISGKISGAEILSAIKTLSDLEEQRPNRRQVEHIKSHPCSVTEILKIKYNNMLKTKCVSEAFKEYHLSQGRHIFNVEYLIISQVLAKRLSAYIVPCSIQKQETILDKFLTVTCDKGTQKIKSSFLETSLRLENEWKEKLRHSQPPAKFHILECLLPVDQGSSGKLLLPECPLTNTILNLALNKLDHILNDEMECRSSVCFQRQALLIHAHQSKKKQVVSLVEKFQEDSGIIFHKIFHIEY